MRQRPMIPKSFWASYLSFAWNFCCVFNCSCEWIHRLIQKATLPQQPHATLNSNQVNNGYSTLCAGRPDSTRAHSIEFRSANWNSGTNGIWEIWIRWISLLLWNRIPHMRRHTPFLLFVFAQQKTLTFFVWYISKRNRWCTAIPTEANANSQQQNQYSTAHGKYLLGFSSLMFLRTEQSVIEQTIIWFSMFTFRILPMKCVCAWN